MELRLQVEIFALLLLAAFLSAVIGLDRERNDHRAGLRTHMLVGIGACLFTILSRLAFPAGDPARIAAQVVSGIGFLGAGAILKQEDEIHGLTTAASIWITAAVGMAAGAGAWFLALATTVLIWIVLVVIRRFEDKKPDEPADDQSP
jgi:putative Mg2+ transporter-C (MgtC) family protein